MSTTRSFARRSADAGVRPSEGRPPAAAAARRWPPVLAAALGLSVLLGVLLTAFAWPATNSAPHQVPIAVAAPGPAAGAVEQGLRQAGDDAFAVTSVQDRRAAVDLIENRDVYGAIVVSQGRPELLLASAASPAVAQLLQRAATGLAAGQPGVPPPTVTDVVPTPADDPGGHGLIAGALPMVLGGIITAGALSRLAGSRRQRLVGIVTVSVLGGALMTGLLQGWLGALSGNYLANTAVLTLVLAAIAAALLGLEWVLGLPGFVLGAAVLLLLGNPLSGLTSAPELLPTGWGALGQLLPPGAGGTALRSAAFFDGAQIGAPLTVLAVWLLVGVALLALPRLAPRRAIGALGAAEVSAASPR